MGFNFMFWIGDHSTFTPSEDLDKVLTVELAQYVYLGDKNESEYLSQYTTLPKTIPGTVQRYVELEKCDARYHPYSEKYFHQKVINYEQWKSAWCIKKPEDLVFFGSDFNSGLNSLGVGSYWLRIKECTGPNCWSKEKQEKYFLE